MEYMNNVCSTNLKSNCYLHSLVYNYLCKNNKEVSEQKLKKKVYDASRKFFIEDYHGRKTLRLKSKPAVKVHTSTETVYFLAFKFK